MSNSTAAAPADPAALVRSKAYLFLLLLAAVVGVVVSVASWGFLELIHYLQLWVYKDLPSGLGFGTAPTWWALPVLGIAGLVVAFAIVRLPGHGGHEPSQGLSAGPPTTPVQLPGVVLAAVASVGLGVVLGPEAPLIALGTGLGILSIKLVRKDAPEPVLALISAAAAFAAISSLFGSPLIGAIIIIEAAGIGGATLPVVLLPGLLAAGIGSLVFLGLGSVTGLSTTAYAIAPLTLPAYPEPTLGAFGWTVALAAVTAVVVFGIVEIARRLQTVVAARPFVAIPAGALLVGLLAIGFAQVTGESQGLVLFSGQDAMGPLVDQAATVSIATLALLVVFKGLAYAVSLAVGRGGPTFPAMFLGIVGGLMAAGLPGFAERPAVATLMAAGTVTVLRLPLSSILLAIVVSEADLATTPLIIVAVVVAYIIVQRLTAAVRPESAPAPAPAPAPA